MSKTNITRINKSTSGRRGIARHPLYSTWAGMRERCYKTFNISYPNYGGRGIKVCDRWQNSFRNFYDDMGDRPSPSHTLDRLDNNKDYSPENCAWSTKEEQGSNKRNTIKLFYRGGVITYRDAAAISGLSHKRLYSRIAMQGWTVERAIETPVAKRRPRKR